MESKERGVTMDESVKGVKRGDRGVQMSGEEVMTRENVGSARNMMHGERKREESRLSS